VFSAVFLSLPKIIIMRKPGKKGLTIFAIIVVLIVALGLSLNFILGSIVRGVVKAEMNSFNEKNNLNISVDKLKINVFSRALILKGIHLKPDSSYFEDFKNGNIEKHTISELNIADMRFKGLNVSGILIDRHFELNRIIVKGLSLSHFKTNKFKKLNLAETKNTTIKLDSIHIPGLEKIDLSKIEVEAFKFQTIDVKNGDTVFSYLGNEFEITGIALDSYENAKGYFSFNNEKLHLKLRRQRIDLKGGDYFVYFDKLSIHFADSLIKISNLKFKPTSSKQKLAASYKFTKEVFDVELKNLTVYGFKLKEVVRFGIIDVDSVVLNKLNIELYKNKDKPWDFKRRPVFLQQQLKKMKVPLHIAHVFIRDSYLKYAEKPKGSKKLMVVEIPELNAQLDFVCSMKDSIRSSKNLMINLKGKLMNASYLDLDIVMPYNSSVDTFYFSGNLSSANFVKFNPAVYPATGIKFTDGKINRVLFSANASPKRAEGQMTMLYEGLQAEVTKADVEEKNKALSWIANAVVPPSNPSRKGKVRVAKIETERVEYKGMGNLLWKSVQSGLVNTIVPFSKKVKPEKKRKKSWFRK
jgi:hypothetical protein